MMISCPEEREIRSQSREKNHLYLVFFPFPPFPATTLATSTAAPQPSLPSPTTRWASGNIRNFAGCFSSQVSHPLVFFASFFPLHQPLHFTCSGDNN